MSPDIWPEVPKDQLERIEPIVKELLRDLRQRTRKLTCHTPSAVDYTLDGGRSPASSVSEAGE